MYRIIPQTIYMDILIDDQIFSLQKFGGISRYFVEIMNRMPDDINVINATLLSDNYFLKEDAGKIGQCISLPHLWKKKRIYSGVNGWLRNKLLKKGEYDLFHPTYFDPYFLGVVKRPYVITVHDMIYERFPELFSKDDPTIEQKRKTITGADRIIAISEYTKADVMDIYGIPEDRIDVIYHGHSMNAGSPEAVDGLPQHYVLYVGQRYHYKNFDRFLMAFGQLHDRHRDVHLLCTGRNFSDAEREKISRLGLEGYVSCRFVTDNQLAYLYKNALCFAFPSLYEGFGIPILESFAMGCPVLLSDASCFPEVAGDSAVYFNPYEVDSMASALIKTVEDSDLRASLKTKGFERLSNYSWEKTAKETAELYRRFS